MATGRWESLSAILADVDKLELSPEPHTYLLKRPPSSQEKGWFQAGLAAKQTRERTYSARIDGLVVKVTVKPAKAKKGLLGGLFGR